PTRHRRAQGRARHHLRAPQGEGERQDLPIVRRCAVRPYWQSVDGALTVYHAPFEEVLEAGVVPFEEVALIHDDPPYGQKERTARGAAGRGRNEKAGTSLHSGRFISRQVAQAANFPPVAGDDRPYDPAAVMALRRPTVTWGAQRYADKLPASPSW